MAGRAFSLNQMGEPPQPTRQLVPSGSAKAPKPTQTSGQKAPRLFNICLILLWAGLVDVCRQPVGNALRMINLDVPETAIQGDTHKLSCLFTLQSSHPNHKSPTGQPQAQTVKKSEHKSKPAHWMAGKYQQQVAEGKDDVQDDELVDDGRQQDDEQLYAVKWYKDEREFFRYLAQEWPRKQLLPLEGLNVDVDSSDNQTVVLRNVSLKTSGSFRCEVSTDAPTFVTKSIERKMHIFALPNEGPSIERLWLASNSRQASRVQLLGEQLHFRCLSKESKPAAKLDWIINDTHNLSASLPLSPSGELIFKFDYRRLVRLPTHQPVGAAAGQTSTTYQIHQADDQQDNQATTNTVPTYPLQQSAPGSVINMAGNLLGQLLETSMSELNFTVDNNLIEFLSTGNHQHSHWPPFSSAAATTQQASSLISTNPARKQSTKVATHGSGAQMKWKKSGGPNSGGGGGRQSTINTELALKIKCVARMLHLTMSDEIKLRLANRTRDRLSSSDGLLQMGAQKQTKQEPRNGNSGMINMKNGSIFVGLMLLMTTTTIISIQLAWSAKIV